MSTHLSTVPCSTTRELLARDFTRPSRAAGPELRALYLMSVICASEESSRSYLPGNRETQQWMLFRETRSPVQLSFDFGTPHP